MRYIMELSYKGAAFKGWQRQPNAASVQEELEKALFTLFREEIALTGSSRTDTGVHARQQYAHFDTDIKIDTGFNTVHRLNGILSPDISLKRLVKAKPGQHTRFDAVSRKYIYRISSFKDPFDQDFSTKLFIPLDFQKMNDAAGLLLKYDDFQCFSKVKTDVNTFICHIKEARWETHEGKWLFHIRSNRFLRGMVRAIVGTLLDVGTGKISVHDFEEIILSGNRQKAGKNAPAAGLTLEEVTYPEDYFGQGKMTFEISEAHPEEMPAVRGMFEMYAADLGIDLCFQGFVQELDELPGKYSSPDGTILLARTAEDIAGVVALRKLEEGVCEMKRLFVKDAYKGHGIGKALALQLIDTAREMGYSVMKLDTLERLAPAVKMYRTLGFLETEAYNYNPEGDILYFYKNL